MPRLVPRPTGRANSLLAGPRLSRHRRPHQRTSCRNTTPRFRWTTPAHASPRTAPELPRSVAQGGGTPGDAGDLDRRRRLSLCQCLQAGLRHLGPSVQITLAGAVADMREHVDVVGLSGQVAGPGVLLGDVPERIERVYGHGVFVGDLVDDGVVEVTHGLDDILRRERPIAVRVREVGLPTQHVLVEPVHVLDTDFVADEAGVEMPLEHVDGSAVAGRELRKRPTRVTVVDVLGAPKEIRYPADVALGERESQLREVGV